MNTYRTNHIYDHWSDTKTHIHTCEQIHVTNYKEDRFKLLIMEFSWKELSKWIKVEAKEKQREIRQAKLRCNDKTCRRHYKSCSTQFLRFLSMLCTQLLPPFLSQMPKSLAPPVHIHIPELYLEHPNLVWKIQSYLWNKLPCLRRLGKRRALRWIQVWRIERWRQVLRLECRK